MQVLSLLQHIAPRRMVREWCADRRALRRRRGAAGTACSTTWCRRPNSTPRPSGWSSGWPTSRRPRSAAASTRMRAIEAMSFDEGIAYTESQIALLAMTEDAKEGLASFNREAQAGVDRPLRRPHGLPPQPTRRGTAAADRRLHGPACVPGRAPVPRAGAWQRRPGHALSHAAGAAAAEGAGPRAGAVEPVPAGLARHRPEQPGVRAAGRNRWAACCGPARSSTARRRTPATWRCWRSTARPSSSSSGCSRCWKAASARPSR